MATDEVKDLYKLIGNYERFAEQVDNKLASIEDRLDEGNRTFDEIKQNCIARTHDIQNLNGRVDELETSGLPKRTRIEMRGTTVTAVALAIWEALKIFMGWIG